MTPSTAAIERERWSSNAQRLGMISAGGILVVGILYLATIAIWLIVEARPREPIGDPYLAVMEVLTLVSALALLGLVVAIWCFADAARRVYAIMTLALGSLAVGLTMAVHFVQLTAIRQMWRAGQLVDYRLVWPSVIFAAEYFAWDVLVGLTMASAGLARSGGSAGNARRALLCGGTLCLMGAAGPLSGCMLLQNVAGLGYAVVQPIAATILARVFRATSASGSRRLTSA